MGVGSGESAVAQAALFVRDSFNRASASASDVSQDRPPVVADAMRTRDLERFSVRAYERFPRCPEQGKDQVDEVPIAGAFFIAPDLAVWD